MSLKPHETSPNVKKRDSWECVPQNNNEEGGVVSINQPLCPSE